MDSLRQSLSAALTALAFLIAAVPLAGQTPATAVIRVRVMSEAGTPLDGVQLLLTSSAATGAQVRGQTDGNGIHTIRGVSGGKHELRAQKIGFRPAVTSVTLAAGDSVNAELVLRAGSGDAVTLAPIVSRAQHPADTVEKLRASGFYDRFRSGKASWSSFIEGRRVQGMYLVSDVDRLTSRRHGLCMSNLYIDGVRTLIPDIARRGSLRKSIDYYVNPSDVAGIETYGFNDVVPSFLKWSKDDDRLRRQAISAISGYRDCVTLIWLK